MKAGARVTSRLLVGEWTVTGGSSDDRWVDLANEDGDRAALGPESLTLVAPPLPPEPRVGTTGFVGEQVAIRRHCGWLLGRHGFTNRQWAEVAADFVPAVPKPTVEQMADALKQAFGQGRGWSDTAADLIDRLWPEDPS